MKIFIKDDSSLSVETIVFFLLKNVLTWVLCQNVCTTPFTYFQVIRYDMLETLIRSETVDGRYKCDKKISRSWKITRD